MPPTTPHPAHKRAHPLTQRADITGLGPTSERSPSLTSIPSAGRAQGSVQDGQIVADLLADHADESAVAQIVRDGIRDGLLGRDELERAAARYGIDYGHGSATEFAAVLAGRHE
jgi:hypothetical protein